MNRRALNLTADSLASAISKMPAMSKRAVRAVIHTGARQMVQEPWRILRALYDTSFAHGTFGALASWPFEIERCERLLSASEAKAAAGHWTFNSDRHLALRQALIALWFLRIKELVEAKHADLEAAE